MTRITAEHLSREAWVYVRQSTPDQVRHNRESRGRQYGLEHRARELGWREVVVVDDDLGQSGGGTHRRGYDRLLAAVCRSEVGVVLSLEASRLARNGREWHTLIDYCGLVGCLLADETSIYDPRLPDDRLLLGMLCGIRHNAPYVGQPVMSGSERNLLSSKDCSCLYPT